MALADTKPFEQCIEDESDGNKNEVRRLMEAWKAAAAKFKTGDKKSYVDFLSPSSAWASNAAALKCVSKQRRLKLVSTEPVVSTVFDRAVLPRLLA